MLKFLFKGAILSALFGALRVIKTTREGPRDWRLILMWVAWAATTAIAVGTVVQEAQESDDQLDY